MPGRRISKLFADVMDRRLERMESMLTYVVHCQATAAKASEFENWAVPPAPLIIPPVFPPPSCCPPPPGPPGLCTDITEVAADSLPTQVVAMGVLDPEERLQRELERHKQETVINVTSVKEKLIEHVDKERSDRETSRSACLDQVNDVCYQLKDLIIKAGSDADSRTTSSSRRIEELERNMRAESSSADGAAPVRLRHFHMSQPPLYAYAQASVDLRPGVSSPKAAAPSKAGVAVPEKQIAKRVDEGAQKGQVPADTGKSLSTSTDTHADQSKDADQNKGEHVVDKEVADTPRWTSSVSGQVNEACIDSVFMGKDGEDLETDKQAACTMLVSMGVPEEHARKDLQAAGGDIERAGARLRGGCDEEVDTPDTKQLEVPQSQTNDATTDIPRFVIDGRQGLAVLERWVAQRQQQQERVNEEQKRSAAEILQMAIRA